MQPRSPNSPSAKPPRPNSKAIKSLLPLKRSDLGSDEEWHLTMASDSDVDDPEQSSPNPPDPAASPDPSPDPSPDQPELQVHWHNSDEENYIDDVKQSNLPVLHNPTVSPRPPLSQSKSLAHRPQHQSPSPSPSASAIASYPPLAQHHHPQPALEQQDNPDDQLVLIPGYRGSSSRHAVANQHQPSLQHPEPQPSSSTHPPRGNPVPLESTQPCTEPSQPPHPPSHPSSEPLSKPKNTLTTTNKNQQSNSIHSHLTKQTQSAQSKPPSPSTDSQWKPPNKPTVHRQQQQHRAPTTSSSATTSSVPASESPENDSRRTSAIRATLRDSSARVTAARLSASSRHSRPSNLGHDPNIYPNQYPTNNFFYPQQQDPDLFVPLQQTPHYQVHPNTVPYQAAYQYLNVRPGDDPYRQETEPARPAARLAQPSNPVFFTSATDFGTPGASSSIVPPEHADSMSPAPRQRSHLPTQAGRTRLQPPTSSTKDLSFLECIVEILKGCAITRRKYLLSTMEGEVWLTPDLDAIQYRMFKKGQPAVVRKIFLEHMHLVRCSERELTIEVINQKKPLQFIFQTLARAETWLSALSCLVPSHTIVMLRHRKLGLREKYNPVNDAWNGKPVAMKKQVNEYIILGTIGKGSFGKVKLALSREDRKFYALKVIGKSAMMKGMDMLLQGRPRNSAASAPLAIDDVNEILVMNGLDHTNVIKLRGVFDAAMEDRLYIALEFLPRGPIMRSTSLMTEQTMPEDKARLAFIDVLSGLQYLHSKNVVHCDIKPDNLLQAGDGTVKICDFGAAIRYGAETTSDDNDATRCRQTMGTPAFAPPELCLYQHTPPCPARRFAADIWSLGATLFYLVYGQVPFPAEHFFQIYAVICTEPLAFPRTPSISKSLKSLLQQMMQKSPEERATIESILDHPWLTEAPEIREKLDNIRAAISSQSNGTSTERRQGLPLQNPEGSVPPR